MLCARTGDTSWASRSRRLAALGGWPIFLLVRIIRGLVLLFDHVVILSIACPGRLGGWTDHLGDRGDGLHGVLTFLLAVTALTWPFRREILPCHARGAMAVALHAMLVTAIWCWVLHAGVHAMAAGPSPFAPRPRLLGPTTLAINAPRIRVVEPAFDWSARVRASIVRAGNKVGIPRIRGQASYTPFSLLFPRQSIAERQ